MFDPAGFSARAPAQAPFISIKSGEEIAYLESIGCSNQTTKSACLAIIYVLAKAAKIPGSTSLKSACSLMFTEGSAEAVISFVEVVRPVISEDEGAEEESENSLVGDRAGKQMNSATQWIIDLVTASKKKMLDGSNVEGYYSALGRSDVKGTPVARIINNSANYMTDKINNAGFREGLTDNIFMKYHTSRVSTGGLLFEMIEVFTDLQIIDEEGSAFVSIRNAKDAPHDIGLSKEIPVKLVGYAALFFEVSGKDVGKWYQGEKALQDVPAVRIKAIKSVFRKYLELKNKIGEIDSASNLDGLIVAIGSDLF
jgi:hypothetical protein